MTVQLNLPPDVEEQLKLRAAAQGRDVSAIVLDLVTNQLANEESTSDRRLSSEEFKQRLHAMANRFPGFGANIDDSRESIYAGRGE